jgi:hypothetical protein
MLEQQRKVEEEDRVTVEHTNITEIEYAGGRVDREYIEKEEEGEFYTTTTTSIGLMMNPPDEYFTRIQINGRRIQPLEANVSRSTRKVNYENELRRRRYNVEHHTTRRSYGGGDFQRRSSSSFEEEERQEWKRPSRSRTPHQTTTYFVLKKQLDAASEGVKNPPPQQRHSSVGVYGRSMVTDGRGLVERSSQTDDFVDVCSRLRLCSTKMKKPPPASSSAPSADGEELSPVNNYEYLICRNKNHHGQLDHCNPERVYTVARKKQDSGTSSFIFESENFFFVI